METEFDPEQQSTMEQTFGRSFECEFRVPQGIKRGLYGQCKDETWFER